MNYDEYGEVINGQSTYEKIAIELTDTGACLVGWTDGNGTHLDILFTLAPAHYGNNFQGGIRPGRDLFVSVMRRGAFAFEVSKEAETFAGYYDEKLGGGLGSTSEALAELINQVRRLV